MARRRRLASSQNAGARASQRVRSMTTRRDGSPGAGVSRRGAQMIEIVPSVFGDANEITAPGALRDVDQEAMPGLLGNKAKADGLAGRWSSGAGHRLLAYFGRVEWLVRGLEPIQQGLASGEAEGAHGHAQASTADNVLQFFSDGSQCNRIVATLHGTGVFHVLLTVAALGREADIVGAGPRGSFQSLDEIPDRPGIIELVC